MTEDFPRPTATCRVCGVSEKACIALTEDFSKPCCVACHHPNW